MLAFILKDLPEWLSAVWSLHSNEPLLEVVAKKMQEFQLPHFSMYWISSFFGWALLIAILYLLITGRRTDSEKYAKPVIKADVNFQDARPEFPRGANSATFFGLRVSINICLRNEGAPTTITKIGLRGLFDGSSFEGQSLSLADHYLKTTTVSDAPFEREPKIVGTPLSQNDLQKDLPFELDTLRAHPGWLRFYFPAIPHEGEIVSGDFELLVTDGTGTIKPIPLDKPAKQDGEIVWRTGGFNF